jgi:hypothetical protein
MAKGPNIPQAVSARANIGVFWPPPWAKGAGMGGGVVACADSRLPCCVRVRSALCVTRCRRGIAENVLPAIGTMPVGKGAFGSDTRPALPLKGAPMEPEHPGEAPRPKGFVRRNRFSLSLAAILAAFACVELGADIGSNSWSGLYSVYEGDIHLVFYDLSNQHLESSLGWNKPAFGTRPSLEFNNTSLEETGNSRLLTFSLPVPVFAMVIPIWLPASCLIAWITFREWRRRRAAKGKAGSG